MSTRQDPLSEAYQSPDRVFYATGMLLDAQDFLAEQLYHRARLARALTYLHGSGTVAGLRVEWEAETPEREESLLVRPGLAVDRLGRLIEIPRDACIRLNRWYEAQNPDDLVQGLHGPPFDGVVVDVFVRYEACERGKTPAFATGPFDALDAVQPSRLRDAYRLELVIRREANPNLPANPWPDLAAITDPADRRTALHNAIFDAWREGPDDWLNDGPAPLAEHAVGQDTRSLFLARLVLPATVGPPETRPIRTAGAAVQVDNDSRHFVAPAGALSTWVGAAIP